jgi:hypothetical protein
MAGRSEMAVLLDDLRAHNFDDAADVIENLTRLLKRYREETPLGHQPHMIADEVDKTLHQ